MIKSWVRRWHVIVWQLVFVTVATSWLLAPILNKTLSYRTALISQYETSFEPYSWLFRAADALGGLILLLAAWYILKNYTDRIVGWLVAIVGLGLLVDPIFSTTCHLQGAVCSEYVSPSFIFHAIETVITASTVFLVAAYDGWRRKKIVSIAFAVFQIGYGVLFASQLASQDRFNTFSQYVYQTAIVVWMAWFVRDLLIEGNFLTSQRERSAVRILTAGWAFINGLLAIVLSLADIHLLGRIRGLYFAGDSAWLAQHGVIIGVVLLYISRHLARGEARARQIFLGIVGIEALKYSVISPNLSLLLLYLVSFAVVFVLRDDFDRGVIPLTWRLRLKELYFMLGALGIALATTLLMLDRDSRVSIITGRAFDHFFDYVARSDITARSHLRSALLAHTISAFAVAALGTVLWILFRPASGSLSRHADPERIERMLRAHSNSSEDYFKIWPNDKNYYWHDDPEGFVAYKKIGGTVFGLADPIGSKPDELVAGFCSWAKARRLKVGFFPVYENSLRLYKKAGLELLQIGSSALVNIKLFTEVTSKDKWWRWQKNRAGKAGYTFGQSTPPHSKEFVSEAGSVSDAWLSKEGRTEHGFAMGYFDEYYLQKCRVFYMRDDMGQMVAFTNLLPQFKPFDVATVDLLRHRPEIDNAMPFLLYKTIEALGADGYHTFDLGFVPFAKTKSPLMEAIRTISSSKFSARGLEQFKNKFNPKWQPNYLAYDGDLGDLAVIGLSVEKAMNKTN